MKLPTSVRLVALIALFASALSWSGGRSPMPGTVARAQTEGKHITISLSRQRLRAWEGHRVVLVTPITTGNAALPTPVGRFQVYARYSPYTFVSPWPAGSPYWYPTSRANFALEFLRGYFIHDAPWRSVYGPGSNGGAGPGTNYGGTHGCVNVPYNAARFLYSWAPIGTTVHVVP